MAQENMQQGMTVPAMADQASSGLIQATRGQALDMPNQARKAWQAPLHLEMAWFSETVKGWTGLRALR